MEQAYIKKFVALLDTGDLFRGTFPADQIPNIGSKQAIFIVNTGTSTTNGEHWITVFQENEEKAYLFDSFGRPPDKLNDFIADYFSRYKEVYFNEIPFQDPSTLACGYYCLFLILRVVEGFKIDEAIAELWNCCDREKYVESVVKEKAAQLTPREPESTESFFFGGFLFAIVLMMVLAVFIASNVYFSVVPGSKAVYSMYSDMNYGLHEEMVIENMDVD